LQSNVFNIYGCVGGRYRSADQRVRINVSGYHFETALGVLERHPGTLLGDRLRRAPFYDRERGEFFFDRHRPSFEAIFIYYQRGGRLRRPEPVPDDVFLDELFFYELEPAAIDEYRRRARVSMKNTGLEEQPP